MSTDVDAMVEEAVHAYRAGDKASARTLLKQAVELDAENERAWMWLGALSDTVKEQRAYLENVLRINPDNHVAQKAWQLLKSKPDDSPGVMFIESYAAAEGMSSVGGERAKRDDGQTKPAQLRLLGIVFAVSLLTVLFFISPFWISAVPVLLIYQEASIVALAGFVFGALVFALSGGWGACGFFLLWGLVVVVSFVLIPEMIEFLLVIPWLIVVTVLAVIVGADQAQRGRYAVEILTGALFVGMTIFLAMVLLSSVLVSASLEDHIKVENDNFYLIMKSDLMLGDDAVLYKCNQFGFACEEVERFPDCDYRGCELVIDGENNVYVSPVSIFGTD